MGHRPPAVREPPTLSARFEHAAACMYIVIIIPFRCYRNISAYPQWAPYAHKRERNEHTSAQSGRAASQPLITAVRVRFVRFVSAHAGFALGLIQTGIRGRMTLRRRRCCSNYSSVGYRSAGRRISDYVSVNAHALTC